MTTSTSITTVDQNDHAAAAQYLMRHAGTTAAVVLDGRRSDRPMGTITDADIAQAVARGRNLDEVRVRDLIPGTPTVINAAMSVRDTAPPTRVGTLVPAAAAEDSTSARTFG
jgi:CBS domain-containing protein